jgi:outer membrane immunogenic protein
MLRGVFSAGFVLLSVVSSYAADMPLPGPTPTPPPFYSSIPSPPQRWSGYYFGVNGGYGFGTSSWSDANNPGNALIGGTTPAGTSTGDFNVRGALAGGTLGLNMQVDSVVLGIESDFDWSDIRGSVTPTNGFCNLPVSVTGAGAVGSTCETKTSWLGTARLRIGYTFDRVLLYGTAGAAFGDVQAGLTGSGLAGAAPATAPFQSNVQFGWTVGGGLEVAFYEGWSAKLEYLFVNLGSAACNSQASCGIDGFTLTGGITPANDRVLFLDNIIRVGVNYRFGSW